MGRWLSLSLSLSLSLRGREKLHLWSKSPNRNIQFGVDALIRLYRRKNQQPQKRRKTEREASGVGLDIHWNAFKGCLVNHLIVTSNSVLMLWFDCIEGRTSSLRNEEKQKEKPLVWALTYIGTFYICMSTTKFKVFIWCGPWHTYIYIYMYIYN